MARVSRSELDAVFKMYLKAMGRREATSYSDVGGWQISQGGSNSFSIVEISNKQGGESQPIGYESHSVSELAMLMRFAVRSIEAKNRR